MHVGALASSAARAGGPEGEGSEVSRRQRNNGANNIIYACG